MKQPDPAGRRSEQVYSITSASEGHSDELGAREIRYAISMGLRTLCFLGGIAVWSHVMWLGAILFGFAIFLPYTSVVLANAGVRKRGEGTDILKPEPYGALGPAEDPAREQPEGEEPVVDQDPRGR